MDTPTSFGEWLRQRRKALGLTHATLAARAYCSVSSLCKIEQDERRPSYRLAERLAECLRIPAAEHERFLAIARAELRVERLEKLSPVPLPPTPAPRATPTPPPSAAPTLPLPPTPLIGRDGEVALISAQLADPQCRLLTLLGPGGIGKSRLALAAAWEAHTHQHLAAGVHWVALASVSHPAFILPAIANAIGLRTLESADVRTHLLHFLRDQPLLLVLDNLEQLLANVDWLSELLRQAPKLKILATSRERLQLQGEWVYEVQGLALPPLAAQGDLERYAAVALFMQSARRAQIDFQVPANEWPWIARICQLLEGLPLALELSASWVRLLSSPEIARQIERSLGFLTTTMRDLPERHRSLRAAFDHSWRLLSPDEQRVLRQLGVFRGGFRLEAAEAVAGATLAHLAALADKSLLRRAETGRYEVHELIRQYAASLLQSDPAEEAAAQGRHARYYLTLLGAHEQALYDRRQGETVKALTPDIDNLRLAWAWAVAHAELELLCQVARPLWYYCLMRSLFQEGEVLFRQAVEKVQALSATGAHPAEVVDVALGRLRAYQAALGQRIGRTVQAKALLRVSIDLLRRREDQAALADALWFFSTTCWLRGEIEESSPFAREGYALTSSLPSSPWLLEWSFYWGSVAHERGEYTEAYRWLSNALALSRATGNSWQIAVAASFLCRTARKLGQFTEMEHTLRDILHTASATGDHACMGISQEQLAQIARTRGDFAEARRLCEESIALFRQIGDFWALSRVLTVLGKVLRAMGEIAEARRSFVEAFITAVGTQAYPTALGALTDLAAVWPQPQPALTRVLIILQHPASPLWAKIRAERLRVELEAKLTPHQIEAAQASAQTTNLEALAQARMEAPGE